jgi:hypothetical protein
MTPPPMYSSPPIVGSSFIEKQVINYSTNELKHLSKDEEQEAIYDPETAIRKHGPTVKPGYKHICYKHILVISISFREPIEITYK